MAKYGPYPYEQDRLMNWGDWSGTKHYTGGGLSKTGRKWGYNPSRTGIDTTPISIPGQNSPELSTYGAEKDAYWGLNHPEAKRKRIAPDNYWSAMKRNQGNSALYGGWKNDSNLGTWQAHAPLTEIADSIRFMEEGAFYSTMKGSKYAGAASRGLGTAATTNAFRMLRDNLAIDVTANVRGIRGSTGVTFNMPGFQGREIVNMPFEYQRGLVGMGGKQYSARSHVSATGVESTFSQVLDERIGAFRGMHPNQRQNLPKMMRDMMTNLADEGY